MKLKSKQRRFVFAEIKQF